MIQVYGITLKVTLEMNW